MKTKLYTFLLSSLLCTGALADNEPWQNPVSYTHLTLPTT